MVKRGALRAGVLLAACAMGGCFDASTASLLVIDNFDSGDLQPSDDGFGMWGCYAINPKENPNVSCSFSKDSEDGSASSIVLDVTVTDVLDGLQQHGGAAMKTAAVKGPVDFTRHGRIAFDQKLESGSPNSLPAAALLYVELGCSTVTDESGTLHDLYVSQGVAYTSVWHYKALTLDNFGPPPWLAEPIQGGTTACLQHVDAVRFSIDAQLPDGTVGEGILHIDNVVLE